MHKRLGLALVILGIVLTVPLPSIEAYDITTPGDVDLKGVVTGPPPSVAAVIESPINGSTVKIAAQIVTGTCDGDVIVEIYKNAIFAGSSTCRNGRFSVPIELVLGSNTLIARVISQSGQYGPDSARVDVTFNPRVGTSGQISSSGKQFILTTSTPTQAVKTGQDFNLNLIVTGGKTPYHIVVDWGDGNRSESSQDSDGGFSLTHRYRSGGAYTISVTATDKSGAQASLQLISLVNGSRIYIDPGSSKEDKPLDSYVAPTLPVIWPLYLLSLVLLCGFLLGKAYGSHQRKNTTRPHKSPK